MAKILAIASGGGHWEQLIALRSGFEGHSVFYANTLSGLAESTGVGNAFIVSDCNRDQPFAVITCFVEVWKIVRKVKPDFIISTGAAPGILAILIGRFLGISTIWIDSIANSEKLSMSGRLALKIANLTITQWKHLATQDGARYWGSIF